MINRKLYTYKTSLFLITALVVEFVFWIATWQILKILGFFSYTQNGEKFSFLHPEFAWCLLSVLFVLLIFVYQMLARNRMVRKFDGLQDLSHLLRPVSLKNLFFKYFFIRNVIVFACFALMQPVYGTKKVHGVMSGVELVFAVDISNSMNTRDIDGKETRLEVAKRAMNQIITNSNVAQVGLVVFAGSAYTQLPLTVDKGIIRMYIQDLNTNFISNQGTNIADALIESSKLYIKEKTKRMIVLISDGENHDGNMEEAYKTVKEKNIEVYTLGIGTEKGGIVPENDRPNAKYLKDEKGQSILSRVNPEMLREIAKNLDGSMTLTSSSFPNVYQILTEINKPSKSSAVNLELEIQADRYRWPLLISILFLIMLFGWELILNKWK
ncbi:MAG: VWA domain-containing protein [Brumimicrobium sp.]|nr:VWA domain-containing protein [Brumimicrobium sp.]